MSTKVERYMCDFCENIFETEREAEACQKGHVDLVNLEITKASYCVESGVNMYGYPDFLIVENNIKRGNAALYEICREDDVESIYKEFD